MSVFDTLVRIGLPLVPKFVVGQVARRYVAGEDIADAMSSMQDLNQESCVTTVDVLGEEVHERSRAEAAVAEYLRLLDAIDGEDLNRNISVKPTMLGLKIDQDLCAEAVTAIVSRAASIGAFVRIDMEDHTCTDATIDLYRRMRRSFDNVGLVLQAYLRRTLSDISALLELKPNIRICKGIYREPRAIAWKDFETVRANFIYATEKLLAGGAYVGIATHDPYLVWAGMSLVDRLGVQTEDYEFQMLLGVDPGLRRIIVEGGHRLRVYVPYGRDWYPYSVRRLRENPTPALHVMRAMLGGSRNSVK